MLDFVFFEEPEDWGDDLSCLAKWAAELCTLFFRLFAFIPKYDPADTH